MKRARFLLITLSIICFTVTSSCSQKNSISAAATTDIFVGSTPCDSLIKSLLNIDAVAKCDFLKWELRLTNGGSDTFQLTALYGESQPNTNGFIGGGNTITLSGTYTISHGAGFNPDVNVYTLDTGKPESAIVLVEIDPNILHFADADKNFIVGNGGWGYALNRIE